jgi:hypothetical protein
MGFFKRFLGKQSAEPPITQPIPSSFPDGVKVLHECDDAIIDVCFVHGINGDRMITWTAYGQTEPWPKTLLPDQISRARILTYGYDAYIASKSVTGSNRLIDHATNLVTDLTADRACCGASSRPLIFVTHRLGVLVCQDAIQISRDNPERHRQDIFLHLKGIIFMGTPREGSRMTDRAKMPASTLDLFTSTNQSLLLKFKAGDGLAESILLKLFATAWQQREAGRLLEVRLLCCDPVSIREKFADMVKFFCGEENGFKTLVGQLLELKSEITERSEPLSG